MGNGIPVPPQKALRVQNRTEWRFHFFSFGADVSRGTLASAIEGHKEGAGSSPGLD